MDVYDVISPASEAELSETLRRAPLTGAALSLTVQGQLDEFSLRRGVANEPVEVSFMLDTISLDRPTMIMGRVATQKAMLNARLEATSGHERDEENRLRLIVEE